MVADSTQCAQNDLIKSPTLSTFMFSTLMLPGLMVQSISKDLIHLVFLDCIAKSFIILKHNGCFVAEFEFLTYKENSWKYR